MLSTSSLTACTASVCRRCDYHPQFSHAKPQEKVPFPSGTEHTRQSEDSHPGGPAWSEPSLALSGARSEGKGWWEGGVSGAIRGGKVSAAAKQGRETEGRRAVANQNGPWPFHPPMLLLRNLGGRAAGDSRGQQGTAAGGRRRPSLPHRGEGSGRE